MTEATAPAADASAAPSTICKFTLPQLEGERSVDVATFPTAVRFDLLFSATAGYLRNRVNAAHQRHQKDEKVLAWAAYDAAQANDPMQTLVPKPTDERPAAPDLEKVLAAGIAALVNGEMRKQGEGKSRAPKDPLISMVTDAVVREVFEAGKASDPKYTFIKAKADVGPDGVAYLNAKIAAKVEAAPEAEREALRTALEKMREERYIKPVMLVLGTATNKATKELPSIL